MSTCSNCSDGREWCLSYGSSQSGSPERYDTFGNCVRDFKSPWFLTWFLISKLWFLISKNWFLGFPNWFLFSHKPNTSNYTLSHPLFKISEAWIVISLIYLRKAIAVVLGLLGIDHTNNLAPYWVLVEFRAWQKLSQKLQIENRISSTTTCMTVMQITDIATVY